MSAVSTHVVLERFHTTPDLVAAAAAKLIAEVQDAGRLHQRFSVGLSGGRVAASLYRKLVELSAISSVPWQVVDFYWADERCVPRDHADSNFLQADEVLLRPLIVPRHHIFRLRGELPPAEAAALASSQVRENIPVGADGLPALDLVLLGMGEDGHIASLFPDAPQAIVESKEPFLAIMDSPKPPPQRITMGYGLLKAAKNIRVIVASGDKAAMLRSSMSEEGTSSLAKLVHMRTTTTILTDQPV